LFRVLSAFFFVLIDGFFADLISAGMCSVRFDLAVPDISSDSFGVEIQNPGYLGGGVEFFVVHGGERY
jgi:hypothetical protein